MTTRHNLRIIDNFTEGLLNEETLEDEINLNLKKIYE
jgi:hypothetical protein